MNYLSFERDTYKDLWKFIKHQSLLQVQKEHIVAQSYGKRKLTHDLEKRVSTDVILPSIEKSTLQDISQHFQSLNRHKEGKMESIEKLEINKSQLKYIQQGFTELEQSKMSLTMREISKSNTLFQGNIKIVPKREPQTVRYLEKKLGIIPENRRSEHFKIQNQVQKNTKPTNLPIEEPETDEILHNFFEETVNIYSYAVPSRRESAQMVIIRDKLFLYGGMSGAGLNTEMWWLDMKTAEWNCYHKEVDFLRTGHSMINYKNFLVIFGGSSYFDHKMKLRQVYSTIGWFDTIKNSWSFTLESVEPRREHKAVLYSNKYMIVSGGLDAAEQLLNDTVFYSFEQKKWVWPKVLLPEGVAQHSMCIAYDYKHNQETAYLYGGRTKDLGSLPLMKLVFNGFQPAQWEVVQATGESPNGRCNHTMECIGDNILIIGGKTYSIPELVSHIYICNVNKNVWSKIQKNGLQTKRWSHCSCIFNTQIICFGGINDSSYLPPHLYSIETDNLKIKGKLVVVKHQSTSQGQEINQNSGQQIIIRAHNDDLKRPCKLERYRNTRNRYEKVSTYIALPQLKQPKFRYDLLIHFVKQVLIKINYI